MRTLTLRPQISRAICLAVACATVWWFATVTSQLAGYGHVRMYETATAPQKIKIVRDSYVDLDAKSILTVSCIRSACHLRLLQGRAAFHIVHDASRSVTVDLDDHGSVTDVGTDFAVSLEEQGRADVIVRDGVIQLDATQRIGSGLHARTQVVANSPVLDGEIGSIERDATGVHVRVSPLPIAEIERRMMWTHLHLQFSGEPLEQAVKEVNRYTSRTIEVDPSVGRDRSVQGLYKLGDLSGFVENLLAVYPDLMRRDNGTGPILITTKQSQHRQPAR